MSAVRPTIGERGRRFTLELPLETPDGFGGVIRTYQPGPLLWGRLRAVSRRERVAAGRPESLVTHEATLPFRADVSVATRLALGPRRFRIREVSDPDGRRRRLVCLVEEATP